MMVLFNLGSLFLGIIALALPVVVILKREVYGMKRKRLSTLLSLSFSSIAVYFQFIYSYYLVAIEDFRALTDIIGSSIVLSGLLIFITIILNFFTFKLDNN